METPTRRAASPSARISTLLPTTAACLVGTAFAACGPSPPEPAPPAPPTGIESTLYLIGDAGEPEPEGEPVLEALTRKLTGDTSERLVVFLGDNLYPLGLPPANAPDRAESERRLDTLLDVFRDSGAAGIMIPGNHDWGPGGAPGRAAILRQESFVTGRAPAAVSYLPGNGCPGPSVRDLAGHLRLVLLDTQWWFEDDAGRGGDSGPCDPGTEEGVVAAVDSILRESGNRKVLILAHHPLGSGGLHAAHGSLARHLFPIRDIHSDFWVPLPILGSLYVLYRQTRPLTQDLSSEPYRHLRDSFMPLLERHHPLMWVSGHDHDLQVLRGGGAHLFVVSGAGIYGHARPVDRTSSTLFARSASGFVVLETTRGGRMRLAVLEVQSDGGTQEVYSIWLDG